MARPLTKQECQRKVLDMLAEIAGSDRATENATRYHFLLKELGKMSHNGLISLIAELIHLRSVTSPISKRSATGRIDCLGDAEKAIDGILTAKGYNLHKVERCDGPGCQSTYLAEAKDTRGVVVTVGYLDGYTHDSLWQKLVNEVAVYMDGI